MKEDNKKIIMVNQYGAQAKYVGFARYSNWGRYLAEKGYDVYIICDANIHNSDRCLVEKGSFYNEVEEDGVKYVYVRTPKYTGNGIYRVMNMIGFYFSACRMLKKLPIPKTIIAQTPNTLAVVAALKFAKHKKVPCICDVVDLWPESIVVYKKISRNNFLIKLLYRLEKWMYSKCDALIFSMAGGYQYICDQGWKNNVNRKKVFHINTGVDLEGFDSKKDIKLYDDNRLYDDKLFKVVYSGSVRLVNGIKLLCDAAKIINRKGIKDIFIMIHGAGDYVEELRKYCLDEKIENVYLYGRIEKDDIPVVLSRADLCVLCYQHTPLLRYGGSMNKLFDYFASGKPIITNAKMGYSLIEEFNCGSELGTTSPEILAEEIIRYYKMNKSEREILGKNSRRAAMAYDMPVLGEQLIDVINYACDDYK